MTMSPRNKVCRGCCKVYHASFKLGYGLCRSCQTKVSAEVHRGEVRSIEFTTYKSELEKVRKKDASSLK